MSDGHGGRTYQLCGPAVLKSSDLAAILGEVYGRTVSAVTPTTEQVAEKLRSFGMSQEMIEHATKLGECTYRTDYPQRREPCLDSLLNFTFCFAAREFLRSTPGQSVPHISRSGPNAS